LKEDDKAFVVNAFQDDVEMADAEQESPLFSDEDNDDEEGDDKDENDDEDERHAAPGDSSSKISSLSVGYKDRSFFVRGVSVFILLLSVLMISCIVFYWSFKA
jgi:hypothetical protein